MWMKEELPYMALGVVGDGGLWFGREWEVEDAAMPAAAKTKKAIGDSMDIIHAVSDRHRTTSQHAWHSQ